MTTGTAAARPLAVTVAMLTYLRLDDLRIALPMVVQQSNEVSENGVDGHRYQVEVVVIDNDPTGSAEAVVTQFSGCKCRYVREPRPGIAAARNRALDEAVDSRLLVFIDDDERPHPGWLLALLGTHRSTGAAAVAGRVVSEFHGDLDPWIRAGGFFRRRQHCTGTQISVAATNNLLLDLTEVRRLELQFDARFGSSGGEDTLFTRAMHAQGAVMVWCNDAVVTDSVPLARMTRRSVLRRSASMGNKLTRTDLELAVGKVSRLGARAKGCLRGAARVATGSALIIMGSIGRSLSIQARGSRMAARGLGMVGGALGYVHHEYRRQRAGEPCAATLRCRALNCSNRIFILKRLFAAPFRQSKLAVCSSCRKAMYLLSWRTMDARKNEASIRSGELNSHIDQPRDDVGRIEGLDKPAPTNTPVRR